LKGPFDKFGKLLSISIPLNNSNNLNRGFAFLEYETKEEAQKAIDGMNGQKFKGRTVALEFSLPKGRYEKKVQNIVEHTNMERKDVILPK
jgi:RNA recognition motif-containing protein